MASWQVSEAREHLDKLLDEARSNGPQFIKNGRDESVVLSLKHYQSLCERPLDFKSFLLSFPKVGELEIDRDKDCGRTIDL